MSDVKPANILFSSSTGKIPPRILISDFGLCKKLSDDQSSFQNTNAGGTVGWRAPECIEQSGSKDTSGESSSLPDSLSDKSQRVSKRIDIFSAGCVFHYVLSFGKHPFGDKFSRENNILKGNYRLDQMDILGEEAYEAKDLVKRMIALASKKRPDAASILMHPYFWFYRFGLILQGTLTSALPFSLMYRTDSRRKSGIHRQASLNSSNVVRQRL